MKNIVLLIAIWLSITTGHIYAQASNFHFTFHNSGVYKITITEVCKHNVSNSCGVITLNPGETKTVVAKQADKTVGMEIDWQLVKRKRTDQIICASSVNWHLKYLADEGYWTFFGEEKRLSDMHKACDAKKITGSTLLSYNNPASMIYKSPQYYCGKIGGRRCYKLNLNID